MKKLNDFQIVAVRARKDKTKSRAKGGITIGVKKCSGEITKIIEKSVEILAIEIRKGVQKTRIVATYMNEAKKNIWKIIGEILEESKRQETLLVGDFNARISNLEGLKEEMGKEINGKIIGEMEIVGKEVRRIRL